MDQMSTGLPEISPACSSSVPFLMTTSMNLGIILDSTETGTLPEAWESSKTTKFSN